MPQSNPEPTQQLIDKVKMALLSMQRASWEQGTAAQAFLELGDSDLVALMAKEAVVRQAADGRLAMLYSDDQVTDPGANGEAVLFAARTTGDPALREAADRMLDYLLHAAPRTSDGVLHHIRNAPQVWIDAMFMAPPFLAVAGHPVEAVRQIEGMRRLLWDPEKKLYSHIWDESTRDFARKDFWGVGNGWTAAGLTRVIRALPETLADDKRRLAGYVRELVDACAVYQREDGLYHDVIDNPATFIETNLAQMLAYSIYRGIKGGWIDRGYFTQAERMRRAAHAKVDAFGLVQGVCGSPHFDHPGTAAEGQSFCLLMEAARRDCVALWM